MGTQRIIGFVLALAITVSAFFFFKNRSSVPEPLRFLTWSNYYPEAMLQEFTAKTGIKVELSYMSSNEELFAKLRAGASGFDLIQPSDYMVRRMIALGMLQPLNHSAIPNLSHLDAYYKNPAYDEGLKYSVPFTWGTTGISLNTAKVSVPTDGVSWKTLFQSPDPKHTSLLDDMREVFGAALKYQGQSINSTDVATLERARQEITKVKNAILTFSSEPKPLILREEITVAHVFSCDALQAQKENPKIRYFIPAEGGTIWTDNFAITAGSQKSKEAHAFINYFLDPDNTVRLIRENTLTTPNRSAREKLSAEETSDVNLYPPEEVLKKMEFLQDSPETLEVMNRMWTELKS